MVGDNWRDNPSGSPAGSFTGVGVHILGDMIEFGGRVGEMRCDTAGVIQRIEFLRPVYIRAVPKDTAAARDVSGRLLEETAPSAMIAIERPGCNANGLYHGLGGRPLDGMVADLDHLFTRGKAHGIPFIGIGDGGNELGMGMLAADLPAFHPKAKDTGVSGRGGVAAVNAADFLIVSNVSNWGATGLIAALSALLENPAVFHEPELESRCIICCVNSGGVDGLFMAPEPAVDGISQLEWRALIRSLRNTVLRTLGHSVDWQGHKGDWR